MEFFFFALLIIAVVLLWDRVTSLKRRLEHMENMLLALRSAKQSQAESVARPVQQAPAAPAAVPAAPEITEPRERVPPSVTTRPEPALRVPAARPERAVPPPVQQAETSPQEEPAVVRLVREYFTGGNLVVRIGVIVLFFGVAFLLKYAAEHAQLSIQVRLIGVAVGAAGLFALGWRLRERRRGFSLALQGGAVGVLYLTLFAALRLYGLVPPGPTFALMAALGVISCLLAVKQDSLALAMLGATGGFLAPILASTGQGSHVTLFSYYALLNVFIVAQAWFKAWRPLNLLAFIFTFGVGAAWGVTRYEPWQFGTTEPFLVFFFLAFVAIAILFAFRAAPQLTHYVDGTLIFGNPVAAMAMQMELVRDFHHGRAWSALVAGLAYLGLAAWLHHRQRDTLRLLKESFLAIGIAFLTMAVPLWLDDIWTSATWALEGAAMFWMGLRQRRWLPTVSGLLLQLAAAAVLVLQNDVPEAVIPVANAQFIGALLICVASLVSARVAAQPGSIIGSSAAGVSHLLLAWGLGWWFYGCGNEVHEFVPVEWHAGAYLGLCAVTALASGALVRRLSWPALRTPALLLLPVMLLAAPVFQLQHLHPFSQGGWLAWPVAFAVMGLNLWWHEASLSRRLASILHGFALWLLALLVSWESGWQVQQIAAPETVWTGVTWAIAPILLLALLAGRQQGSWWPMRSSPDAFRSWVASGFATFLALWSLHMDWSSNGTADPWPYLPLLNPLDIVTGVALLSIARWLTVVWRADSALYDRDSQAWMIGALTAVAFAWLNAVLLRTMHHWNGLPYQLSALMADTAVQAALSIFWTVLALGAMLWANRTGLRVVWFVGAGLMAVVLGKLFLVDLVHVATLARIVSFLVVGGLMLVIGYFSPLPPKARVAA